MIGVLLSLFVLIWNTYQASSPIPLRINVPSKVYTMKGETEFQVSNIFSPVEKIKFLLTTYGGDGEMNVVCHGAENSIIRLGTDKQENTPLKIVEVTDQVSVCTIKVESQSSLSFSVVAQQDNVKETERRVKYTTTLQAILNQPQLNIVEKDATSTFQFVPNDDMDIEVTTTAISGDIDFVVKVTGDETKEYTHSHLETETIKIQVKDTDEVIISVKGIAKESIFQVVVAQPQSDDPILFTEGVPILLNTKGEKKTKLKYYVSDVNKDFVLVLTEMFGYETPTLTVTVTKANEKNTWKGELSGDDNTFSIKHDDMKFSQGWYIIELVCKKGVKDFRFYLQTEYLEHIILLPGVPFQFVNNLDRTYQNFIYYAQEGETQYFSLHNDDNENSFLNFYASTVDEVPSEQRHEFASEISSVTTNMKIEESKKTPYYISVHCSNAKEFTITKTYEDQRFFYLNDKAYISSEVAKGGNKYFYFEIDPFSGYDIEILLHTTTGDLSLFVSPDNEHPSRANHEWKSTIPKSKVNNIVLITPYEDIIDTPRFTGKMFVTVFGYGDSEFYITTKYKESIPEVFHSIPSGTEIAYKEMKYYKYRYPYDGTSTMKIDSQKICYTSMYLSKSYKPISETNQFFKNVLETAQHMQYEQSNGWWYVGVTGKSEHCNYDLHVEEEFGILSSGGSYNSFVLKDQCRNFKIPVKKKKSDKIHIGTTLVSGDIETYVRRGVQPTKDLYDAKDEQYYVNNIVVDNDVSDFFVMVCGKGVNSTFEIHTSYDVDYTAQLQLDSKMALRAGGNLQYAWFQPPITGDNLRVSVLTRNNPVEVYIKEGENPTETDSQWNIKVGEFSYSSVDVQGYTKDKLIFGYKSNVENANFVIVVTKSEKPIQLFTQEYQHFDSVEENQLFQLVAPVYDTTFHVQLDSCTDDPMVDFSLKKFITSNEITLRSSRKHQFSSRILQGNDFKNQKFYLLPDNEGFTKKDFTFNIDYDSTRRPEPKIKKIYYQIRNDQVRFTFQEVATPTSSIDYSVYRRSSEGTISQDAINGLNVKTACATRKKAEVIGKGVKSATNPFNDDSGVISFTTQLNAPSKIESFTVLPLDSTYGYGTVYDSVYPTMMKMGIAKHAIVDAGNEVNLILPQMANEVMGKKLKVVITHFSGEGKMVMSKNDAENFDLEMDEFGVIEVDINEETDLGSYFIKVKGHEEKTTAFSIHCYTEDHVNELENEFPQLMKTSNEHPEGTKFSYTFKETGTAYVHMIPILDTPTVFMNDNFFIRESIFDVYPIDGVKGESIEFSVKANKNHALYYVAVSSLSTRMTLIEGVPNGGKLSGMNETKEYLYYKLDSGDFTMNLFSIYGDVVGYISSTNEHPSKDDHEYVLEDVLVIHSEEASVFYLTIECLSDNAYFHITPSPFESPLTVVSGLPMHIFAETQKNIKWAMNDEYKSQEIVVLPSLDKEGLDAGSIKCGLIESTMVGSVSFLKMKNTKTRFVDCTLDNIVKNNILTTSTSGTKTIVPKGSTSFYQKGTRKFILHVKPKEEYSFSLHVQRGKVRFTVTTDETFIYSSLEGELQYSGFVEGDYEKIYVTIESTLNDIVPKYSLTYHSENMKLLRNEISVLNNKDKKSFKVVPHDNENLLVELVPHHDVQNSFLESNIGEVKTFANSELFIPSGSSGIVTPNLPTSQRLASLSVSGSYRLIEVNDHSVLVNISNKGSSDFQFYVESNKRDICVSSMLLFGNATIVLNYGENSADYPTLKKFDRKYVIDKKGGSFCVKSNDVIVGNWKMRVYSKTKANTMLFLKVDSREYHSKMDIGKPERVMLKPSEKIYFEVKIPKKMQSGRIFLTDITKKNGNYNTFSILGSTSRRYPKVKNSDFVCDFSDDNSKNVECTFNLPFKKSDLDTSLYLLLTGKNRDNIQIDLRVDFFERNNYLKLNEEIRSSSNLGRYTFYSNENYSPKFTDRKMFFLRVESCNPYSTGLKQMELTSTSKFEEKTTASVYRKKFELKNHKMDEIHTFNITSRPKNKIWDNEVTYYLDSELPNIPENDNALKVVSNLTLSTWSSSGFTLRIPFDLNGESLEKVFSKYDFEVYYFQSRTQNFEKNNFHTRCALNNWISTFEQNPSLVEKSLIKDYAINKLKFEDTRYNEKFGSIEYDLQLFGEVKTVINVVVRNKKNQMDVTYYPLAFESGGLLYQILTVVGSMVAFGVLFVVIGLVSFCFCRCINKKKRMEKKELFSITNPTIQAHKIPGESDYESLSDEDDL